MKVGFVTYRNLKITPVTYTWNFSLNIMHLKDIIKDEKVVVLKRVEMWNRNFSALLVPLSYGNYNKSYQTLQQEAISQKTRWLFHLVGF
jgi:hypothetical protein